MRFYFVLRENNIIENKLFGLNRIVQKKLLGSQCK